MKKEKKEYSIHKGNLILVNQFHPFLSENPQELVAVGSNKRVELKANAATVLEYILKDLKAEREIVPVSGFRSIEEQKKIFHDSMIENGEEYTRKYVALPGCSEHHTGLAVDLKWVDGKDDPICPDFPNEGICKMFRKKAAQYGYVLRYPEEKTFRTGIGFEPWHFRYIGYPHSAIMEEKNLSLEEYHEFIKEYPYGDKPLKTFRLGKKMEISFLEKNREPHLEDLSNSICQISGNNMDGYILTQWRQENEIT